MEFVRSKINESLANEILKAKKEILNMPSIPSIDFEGYEAYLREGNRSIFEKQYFKRRRLLTAMGLSLLIEIDDKSIRCLENIIWQVCLEYTWALPPHLPIKNNTYDKAARYCIDLFSAETAQTLAEFYELYEEYFSPEIKNRIVYEINNRVFEPFLTKEWGWERSENNWSAVIGGSVGMTAVSILKKEPLRQNEVFKKVDRCLESYLRGFKKDGACIEGVGYWAYGFGYYCYFAEKYKTAFKDDKYLANPLLKNIANFPVGVELGNNKFVLFADATKDELPTGLLCYCKKQFSASLPYAAKISSLEASECYRWAELSRSLLWTDDNLNTEHAEYKTRYFKDVQWLIMNKENNFVFAAKAGKNNDSHNHNDVGNFILGYKDDIFLTDLGSGQYTKDYFNNEKRYDILVNRSMGHSVPIINGCEEVFGDYEANDVSTDFAEGNMNFSMNIEKVYPSRSNLKKFNRTFDINYNKKLVAVKDSMLFTKESNTIDQNFISKIKPLVATKSIKWVGNYGTLILECNNGTENVEIVKEEFVNHFGVKEMVYRTLIKEKTNSNKYSSNKVFYIFTNRE